MASFTQMLSDRGVLLADGATGTNYQDMGIEPGVAPEEWVLDAPERVGELHRRFAQAGSDLVLTCSFGATALRLADGPLAGRAREVNVRAAEIAREAVGDERLVAGSMGPTGQLVEPFGTLTREAGGRWPTPSRPRHCVEGGVDLLVLETFFALDEAIWAAEGVRSVSDLPLVTSFSFDQGTRTMMGLGAADVVAAIEPARRRRSGRKLRPLAGGHRRDRAGVPARLRHRFRSGSSPTRASPRWSGMPSSTRPTRRCWPSTLRTSPPGGADRRRLLRLDARSHRGDRSRARALRPSLNAELPPSESGSELAAISSGFCLPAASPEPP